MVRNDSRTAREHDGETTMALIRVKGPQADAAVIVETADATLLSRPLRSLVDIEDIERVPLAERLRFDNFCHRVALAIEARDLQDTAIHYVPGGDIDRAAERVSFGELRHNIGKTAEMMRWVCCCRRCRRSTGRFSPLVC
jgi:hypothetical protein